MAFVKDPSEVKDYAVDWTRHLGDAETILSSTWTVPDGIDEPVSPTTEPTDDTATIWLSGGTHGVDYRVTNHVLTNQGREFERTFTVAVRDL
jgi:hypothetical protein